jgi:hypothetical protein
MADLTIKRHDTYPALKATLEQTNEAGVKEPIDLSTAVKVTLIMKSGATLVEGVCTITNAKLGKVEYTFLAKDTEVAGTFNLEFEIDWGGGVKLETVPNEGYREIAIEPDLGVA